MENAHLTFALLKATQEFGPIHRDKTVTVTMKGGGKYTFSYATFENILATVRPALSKYGLTLEQGAETVGGQFVMATTLNHESGEVVTGGRVPLVIPAGAGPQEVGSALSYARRYSLTAMLCLAAEDDDDGNIAEGNTVIAKPKVDFGQPPRKTNGTAVPPPAPVSETPGLDVSGNDMPPSDDAPWPYDMREDDEFASKLRESVLRARNKKVPSPAVENEKAEKPKDAISDPKFRRIFALIHDALRDRDKDTKESVNDVVEGLEAWLFVATGRGHLSHCPYKSYEELCGQIPQIVESL